MGAFPWSVPSPPIAGDACQWEDFDGDDLADSGRGGRERWLPPICDSLPPLWKRYFILFFAFHSSFSYRNEIYCVFNLNLFILLH